jgi:glycosyltransferase involved in cell wall biosynthesis
VLVSERCGCAPDLVVNGRNGFAFDPFDTRALTKLLLRMAGGECDLQKMGQASREIIAKWTPGTFARNLDHAAHAARGNSGPKGGMINHAVLHGLLHQ